MSPQQQIAHYRIIVKLGEGGMGEVYRATDTKLGRDVALKILSPSLAGDVDYMARFQREAEVLASLNHPHIAIIHGLEEAGGVRALVMELVEGPTLAERIAEGPIPVEEALPIALQIAEALEAAHEKGVIHRDLKPANVKVTPGGAVKVLDFGLAKAVEESRPGSVTPNSPTLTLRATQVGLILGTAAYMSPEQAAGKPVDKRSDIWSFGVVLWEMLTGKRLFDGETISHTLADVLRAPIDFTKLPATTPTCIRELLARCLDRDVKNRLQAIGEARIALQRGGGEAPQPTASQPPRVPWAIAAAAVILATAVLFMHFHETPPAQPVLRYTLPTPENSFVHSFAISPDGHYIAIAVLVNGKQQLWLRPLDALQAQPMPSTEDATFPFWSPDSHFIAFFAEGKLKKIAAAGGPAQSLCNAPAARGGSWSRDDVILFSPDSGIQRVPASGGIPVDVIKAKGFLRFPAFLPDGRHFLYLVIQASPDQNGIYVSSLDGKENRRVLSDQSSVIFAAGHLLFTRENTLMAQPLDSVRAETSGDVFPIADSIFIKPTLNYVPVTASANGVLVYESGGALGANQLAWYDHSGKLLSLVGAPGQLEQPSVAPDEKTIAFLRRTASAGDIWLRDLARATEIRFTSDGSLNVVPIWSPAGDRIVFGSNRSGHFDLYQKKTTGLGQDELLISTSNGKVVDQWSRDGRFIVYSEYDPVTRNDLWVLPIGDRASQRKPVSFLQTQFNELLGQLSPDSRWMAYTSDESGQREVYVRPFPIGDGKAWRISTAGGAQPRWRGDSRELFYVAADGKLMSTEVKAVLSPRPLLEPGTPVPLFDVRVLNAATTGAFQYDVTPDGKRFLIITAATGATAPPLTMVVNWTAGLKK